MAVTDKDLDNDLGDLTIRIEKLRVRYQGFFLGLEKLPPLFERDQLEKFIRLTPLNDARRAVHKFRFQALLQRYRTMAVYWDRIMRELEEGKITRETMRREAGYASAAAPDRAPAATDAGTGTPPAGAPAPASKAPAPSGRPESPPAADDPLHRLFDDFITARSSLGLSVEGITEPVFRTSIDKQRQAQAEKLGVPDVTFSVVVKEGRVVLMARPVGGRPAT